MEELIHIAKDTPSKMNDNMGLLVSHSKDGYAQPNYNSFQDITDTN